MPNVDNKFVENLRSDLKKLFDQKAAGCKIRSRTKWFEEGEKSSQYFHNLEKKHAKDKAWSCIFYEDGNTVYGTNNVMSQQVKYYKKIYKSEDVSSEKQDMFLDTVTKTLSEDSQNFVNNDISLSEATKALRKMSKNKSPGPDGIIVEFYQLYWAQIDECIVETVIILNSYLTLNVLLL